MVNAGGDMLKESLQGCQGAPVLHCMAPLQVPVFGAGLRSGRQQYRQQRAPISNASRQQSYNHYENGHGLWVRCSPSVSRCIEVCRSDVHAS